MVDNKERENVRFEIFNIYISHIESESMGNQKMKVGKFLTWNLPTKAQASLGLHRLDQRNEKPPGCRFPQHPSLGTRSSPLSLQDIHLVF
jgi:hypothetical protein